MRLVLIGNASSRRTALLAAAARRRFPHLTVELVPWVDLIAERADLRQIVRNGDCVRIDSPGKDFEAERMLLRAGAEPGDPLAATPDEVTVSVEQMDQLSDERGRIHWPAVWSRGLCRTLGRIGQQLTECDPHFAVNDPGEIQTMFDKTATHARLEQAGIPVVPAIGRIQSYDELVEKMRQNRWQQAFVKLAYGSSASGAVAVRMSRSRIAAFTTVQFDGTDNEGHPKLYNTRRIRELRSTAEVAAVVNAVCRHVAHAERWVPKAGIDGKTFDLRVVVIGVNACHMVARLSKSPITNLNLLNERGDPARVRERSGEAAWTAAISSCEAAMRAFPRSLHAGIDLLFVSGFQRHAVLEVNAFGDLLPGVSWRGMDTYEAELEASFEGACALRLGSAPRIDLALLGKMVRSADPTAPVFGEDAPISPLAASQISQAGCRVPG